MDAFIRCYPGVIDEAICRQIIEKFDADPRKHEGRVLGAGAPKRSTDLVIRGLPDWEPLCKQLDSGVIASLKRYREDVPNFRDVHSRFRDTGYQVQRYAPNGSDGFDWHADVNSRQSAERLLAMIAYLNDVEVGGETRFRTQDLAIAPRAGSVLWFPPGFEYVHRGDTPISGPKYVVTLFLVYP